MIKILVLSYFLLAGIDFFNLLDLRKLVYSFLLSQRNTKGAKKIHLVQPLKSRITLSYIYEYAVYKKEFRFFQKSLMIYYYTLAPQYFFVITVNFFSIRISLMLLFVFFALKFIIAFMISCQFSSKRISKFDKRW